MIGRCGTLFAVAAAALIGVQPAFSAMQESKEAGGVPSVWTLPLGAHATELPVNVFIDIACGTRGGPPSLPLRDWSEFKRCPPEPATGWREVHFRYDDEAEYWALANNRPERVRLVAGTTAYEIPIVASALFDEDGFFVSLRIVTDPRVDSEVRERSIALRNFLLSRYDLAGWICSDLPRRDGETPYGGKLLKQRCERTVADPARKVVVEAHYYRKAGQTAFDPRTQERTAGLFESSVRFEMALADGIADRAARLAALAPNPDQLARDALAQRLRDCQGCPLGDVDAKRLHLESAMLERATLAGANFHDAELANARLAGADLSGANLNKADLRRADLRGANLTGALLYAARMEGADLTGARLSGARMAEARLTLARLDGVVMVDVDIRGARMGAVSMVGAKLRETWLIGAQLGGAVLDGAEILDSTLYEAQLQNASLKGADLTGTDLFGADLTGADLSRANLTGTRLQAARLTDAKTDGTNFSQALMPDGKFHP